MIDDAVAGGLGQLVILGAGYDSFAWRRPDLLDRLTVLEVDHPATQARKREVTAPSAAGDPPVRFVPVDFERQRLDDALPAGGWWPDAPTFFTWQGVTMYLTDDATFATLAFVARSAPGSTIVFQYHVAEDLLPSEVLAVRHTAVAGMARSDEPWINTYRPSEFVARVGALGFSAVESLGAAELNPRLFADRTDGLRWPEVERDLHRHRLTGRAGSEEAGVRAAVDRQVGAGDEAGGLGAQERGDAAEVAGIAEDACRDAVGDPGESAVEAGAAGRWRAAGLHRVHRDAVARDLEGERLEEAGDPGTCGVRQDQVRDRLAHRRPT